MRSSPRLWNMSKNGGPRGINVYGFIVPSCEQMVRVEREMSGFDEDSFIAKFKQAGGTWIDVDVDKYECIDGSHLQDTGAIQFSEDLAALIQQAESQNAEP